VIPEKKVQNITQEADVDLRLEPAHPLRGRVVNTQGEPLAGVWILCHLWRGFSSYCWTHKTDENGRFAFPPPEKAFVLVAIGGTGRPVVGRVHAPERRQEPLDFAWGTHFLKSNDSSERYPFVLEANGAFRIEDVPEGDYTLTVSVETRSPRRPDPDWGSRSTRAVMGNWPAMTTGDTT
jgi:hypothetical protein